MYAVIFVSVFITTWLMLGFLPWLVTSVATRGNAGLLNLPLCLATALVAGLAVPVLGKDDVSGIWLSMAAALLVPSLLLAARRFALAGHASTQPTTADHE